MYRLFTALCLFLLFSCKIFSLQVSGLTYHETLLPGDSKLVKVTLINDKDEPELVDLKLCDYSCNSAGQHFFEDAEHHERSNASWVRLNALRETLPPRTTVELFFTINVPKTPSIKGSYWSVLLIEPSGIPVAVKEEHKEKGFQLHVKVRYAYHIVTDVGEGLAKLKVVSKDIQSIENKKYLAIDVENTGEVFLNPKLTLKLYNKEGGLEKTLEGMAERLYPQNSTRYLLDGEGLQGNHYTAFLLLDNGDGRLFGDSFQLRL